MNITHVRLLTVPVSGQDAAWDFDSDGNGTVPAAR